MNFKVFLLMAGLSMPFLQASEVGLSRFKNVQPFTQQHNLQKQLLEDRLQELLIKYELGGKIYDPLILYFVLPLPASQQLLGYKEHPQITCKDFCKIATDGMAYYFIKPANDPEDQYYAYFKALKAKKAAGVINPKIWKQEFMPIVNKLMGFYRNELDQELAALPQEPLRILPDLD